MGRWRAALIGCAVGAERECSATGFVQGDLLKLNTWITSIVFRLLGRFIE